MCDSMPVRYTSLLNRLRLRIIVDTHSQDGPSIVINLLLSDDNRCPLIQLIFCCANLNVGCKVLSLPHRNHKIKKWPCIQISGGTLQTHQPTDVNLDRWDGS